MSDSNNNSNNTIKFNSNLINWDNIKLMEPQILIINVLKQRQKPSYNLHYCRLPKKYQSNTYEYQKETYNEYLENPHKFLDRNTKIA